MIYHRGYITKLKQELEKHRNLPQHLRRVQIGPARCTLRQITEIGLQAASRCKGPEKMHPKPSVQSGLSHNAPPVGGYRELERGLKCH